MVRTSCKADQNRFPGWEKRLFLYIGLWCKRKAWRSPKPQISVQVRTDLLWLFSVIGNTSGSEPEVVGSNPARAAHGLLVQRRVTRTTDIVYQTFNLRDQGSNPW